MKLLMTPLAQEDFAFWRRQDSELARRITRLLRCLRDGANLPAQQVAVLPLRLPGLNSVRLSSEHRLVFERLRDRIVVHQCRFHY
ncbi:MULTISPECIES: type II toxin-antitoxin system YoeB family toxin [unclassified Herbaspirillum]|uniref:type II toxin-antitoxin system YoeB family toxin n=1 Tax=unclassified Herbaspirillum TaxID=2624150 RepID=UPI001152764F|nr:MULTISPECIES: type II toxin-antitoxin system YoeB family toxin [unclassified Herbaspirillum]MBB5390648.1 toxin YoeB [Herbaspirillum sp. SJZ102]TQK08866.1 toxin YoeB [Herbaspirillum sp. SJZ130]TQK14447.1 toxin YoeB [Herbaspirillum sp. SJZ106]